MGPSARAPYGRGVLAARPTLTLALGLITAGSCGGPTSPSVVAAAKPLLAEKRSTHVLPSLVMAARVEERSEAPAVHAREPRAAVEGRPPEAPVAQGPTDAQLSAWMLDLCDDFERGNASEARWRLRRAWPASRPWLLRGLDSHDHQQRQLSANLLVGLGEPPADDLLRVVVEGLRDDSLPYGQGVSGEDRYTCVYNADDGVAYLRRHLSAARPHLESAFRTGDRQQRLLCAILLARAERCPTASETIPFLVECLGDNHIRGDAALATQALLDLGEVALPWLEHASMSRDDQRRRIATAVLTALTAPSPSRDDLQWAFCRAGLERELAVWKLRLR